MAKGVGEDKEKGEAAGLREVARGWGSGRQHEKKTFFLVYVGSLARKRALAQLGIGGPLRRPASLETRALTHLAPLYTPHTPFHLQLHAQNRIDT
jgi:hypothetical protein